MVPINEALTFDDVTLAPKYSEILPSEVNTSVSLTKSLKLKITLLSSAIVPYILYISWSVNSLDENCPLLTTGEYKIIEYVLGAK